jgi:hypothetical protein
MPPAVDAARGHLIRPALYTLSYRDACPQADHYQADASPRGSTSGRCSNHDPSLYLPIPPGRDATQSPVVAQRPGRDFPAFCGNQSPDRSTVCASSTRLTSKASAILRTVVHAGFDWPLSISAYDETVIPAPYATSSWVRSRSSRRPRNALASCRSGVSSGSTQGNMPDRYRPGPEGGPIAASHVYAPAGRDMPWHDGPVPSTHPHKAVRTAPALSRLEADPPGEQRDEERVQRDAFLPCPPGELGVKRGRDTQGDMPRRLSHGR